MHQSRICRLIRVYTALAGANHTQFGYYANTSDNESFIRQSGDNPATITRQAQLDLIVSNTIKFLSNVPPALETITATDGSTWERVNVPGFGNTNNMSVVAMAEYNGSLYALTRNQAQGCEVWRTTGTGWEQVLFPGGITNGVYGNKWLNNVWARMIVFNGKLYFGFSAGLQGNYLGSTGCEIWRYDGTTWEPVISDMKDIDASGSITGIASCAAGDGSTTATITDSSRSWTTNQWAGGVFSDNFRGRQIQEVPDYQQYSHHPYHSAERNSRHLQQLRSGDRGHRLRKRSIQQSISRILLHAWCGCCRQHL